MNEDKDREEKEEFGATGLNTIAGGAVPELFAYELDRVLRNVDDPNTEPKTKRKVTIELTFTPDASRQAIEVTAFVKSKLAAAKGGQGVIFVVRDRKGDPFAVHSNPHQPTLFKG